MSEILAAAVTPNTEEVFRTTNEEVFILPNIKSILNVPSANNIYGLTNGANYLCNPRKILPIPHFLVMSVVDNIFSSHEDTKTILVKAIKK